MKPIRLLHFVFFFLYITSTANVTIAGRPEDQQHQQHANKRNKKKNKNKPSEQQQQTCRPFLEARKQRFLQQVLYRKSNPKLAYRIMITCILSYLDFHKSKSQQTQEWVQTGFSLRRPKRRNKAIDTIQKNAGRAKRLLSRWLEQGSMLPPAVRRKRDGSNGLVAGDNNNSSSSNNGQHLFVQYSLYDWYESGVAGVNFHDTDVLVSTFGDGTLVISFGGTASPADAVTNIQTFEPANHSNFYHGGGGNSKNIMIQGSLHRGFLNAYSRVDRGSVLRLCTNCPISSAAATTTIATTYLDSFHQHFGQCTQHNKDRTESETTSSSKNKNKKSKRNKKNKGCEPGMSAEDSAVDCESYNHSDTSTSNETSNAKSEQGNHHSQQQYEKRERRNGGCFVKGTKLSVILQDLVSNALRQGHTVHIAGHSLGGGLASHLALDLVVNFPNVPVKKLNLWTMGAPHVADNLFFQSAVQAAPRLGPFVRATNGNGRLHRYVTLSDSCGVDVVSEVTKRALPSHLARNNLRGRVARRLGGVHSDIVHFAEPHYLLTPQQFFVTLPNPNNNKTNSNDSTPTVNSTTHSAVAAHATKNYLMGISRESRHHPLETDLPEEMKRWVGETS